MYQLIFPSILEVVTRSQPLPADYPNGGDGLGGWEFLPGNGTTPNHWQAEREWRLAIAATEQLLLETVNPTNPQTNQGLVLAGPVPVFSHPGLISSLETVTFTAQRFNPLALMPFEMPATDIPIAEITPIDSVIPLLPGDPVAAEQFCLVLTAKFALILVLGEDHNGAKKFTFSFEPEVVEEAWQTLRPRVVLINPDFTADLDALVTQYYPVPPNYRTVMRFSRLLLGKLSQPVEETTGTRRTRQTKEKSSVCHPSCPLPNSPNVEPAPRSDVELLQAFAHEVRTPLATIRTLTRLLLKRRDLPSEVIKRLKTIDSECTDQIDRMELLLRAAELETSKSVSNASTYLTAMSLDQVLQQSIPRWQEAASRRSLTLDVVVPPRLPSVVSNPQLLERVLTGLMENFTRSLPAGSHIEVQVIPAGDQLKLQLVTDPQAQDKAKGAASFFSPPIRKAIGKLLMFQPETGTISLNMSATKDLFQAIGGKLIVRQRPHQGEVLTIFLPLLYKT
ncbi:MAG: HAMP domain-containing sensor histidine kinase [Nostocaceae cyanobacterium]|nr:HAMP domain-containing sensor histidine kinase [Nostocaceae cyanobacterium]